jgi:hypothetical protein
MNRPPRRRLPIWLAASVIAVVGCSNGAAPTGQVSVSDADLKAGAIHVANTYLDSMQQMSPTLRNRMAEKDPHVSAALKKAMAIDPATKARMDSMGINIH